MSTPTPAELHAQKITRETPEAEETVEETEVEEVEPEEADLEESTEEDDEDLPEKVKTVLQKERKLRREADAARAADKAALAAAKAELESLKKKDAPAEEAEVAPVEDRYKKLFVHSAAKSALVEAGLSSGTERFLKMLDLNSVDVDDDGTIKGLSDQVADLVNDFPEVFAPKDSTPAKKTIKTDASGRRTTPVVPKTSAERLAAQING